MTRARLDWETLTMRAPDPEDVERHAEALVRAYNDPKNASLLGHVDEMTRDDVIEHYVDLADGGRPFMLFEGGELVGDGDLRNRKGGGAELSFLIASPSAQGKGLGTRFALLLMTFGFRVLDLTTIFASVAPQNVASLRVFEKLGFCLDNSVFGRSFAEEPSDRVFAIEREVFDHLHSATIAAIVIR